MNRFDPTLTLRTDIQKAIWEYVVIDELLDGAWEFTTPVNHWEFWLGCKVVVGEAVGRNFSVVRASYRLEKLLEFQPEKLRHIVCLAKRYGSDGVSQHLSEDTVNDRYNQHETEKDLREIRKAMKINTYKNMLIARKASNAKRLGRNTDG